VTTKLNLLLLAVLVGAGVLALSGCSTGIQVPEKVPVPVPVACIKPGAKPVRPAVRTEADLMGMDRYRRTLASWSDLVKLQGYTAELEAIVEGCSRLPP